MYTIFQRAEISEPTLFNQSDTTKKIAELYSANGTLPVYQINYKNTEIAFYRSMVGAPACVACFEEILAMGAKKFVLFGSCGVLNDNMIKDTLLSLFPLSREVDVQ